MTLAELVREVAELREKYLANKQQITASRMEWEVSNAGIIMNDSIFGHELSKAEEKLRGAILAAPEEEVKATVGVGIRNTKTVKYDKHKAFRYALEKQEYLSFDAKSFEGAMKLKQPEYLPDFVTVEKVPQATIARDLSEALK